MAHGSGKDKLTGKAKEALGKMTGNRRKEAEGKAEQAKGQAKEALDDAQKRMPGKTGPKDPLITDDE
ncbi:MULTISPECIES: CsbD family protein [unclassified Streptomyces]|uniref:CsbD family protein n=1 Tax=unclassified Streptomyces TaxID=2593676 RepID=UPI0036E2B682